MKYIVEFDVEDGDCELYKLHNPNDADSACRSCALRGANYCMDLNMHKAKVINAKVIKEAYEI